MYRALWTTYSHERSVTEYTELDAENLSCHPIRLRVHYSSLNYKDALAITGKAPVIRQYPLTPGIDAVGEIITSTDPNWPVGSMVIVTGWGIGELYHGGLAEYLSVEPSWLTLLPTGLSALQAAAIGTAGLTAMLAVLELEREGMSPESGSVVVTGASGGVGSFSTWILAHLGYHVTAVSGDTSAYHYLTHTLGANRVMPRASLDKPGKKITTEQWSAAIDCVGSHSLANLLAGTKRYGCVVSCGMAQGIDLATSVAPFILRGIRLVGIDSVYCPSPLRQRAWERLEQLMTRIPLPIRTQTILLDQSVSYAESMLSGQVQGRVIVQCYSDSLTCQ